MTDKKELFEKEEYDGANAITIRINETPPDAPVSLDEPVEK